MADTALGYIGLGLMGWPMCEKLLEAGLAVTVWNRSPEKLEPALAKGAKKAATPAELTKASSLIQTCVTDHRAMEEIVFGKGGVIETATPDKLLIDYSTLPPKAAMDMARRLHAKTGMRWIDAPVTGGRAGALAGKLVVMAGGEEADIERVRPVIMHMAQSFTHMGPLGTGLVTKLCNQTVNACVKVILSEMLALARDGGIDGGRLPEVMKGGSADSSQLQREVPRMVKRDFHPHGAASTIVKDLGFIGDFAAERGTSMPVTALVRELFRMHVERGHAEKDSISICMMYDRSK